MRSIWLSSCLLALLAAIPAAAQQSGAPAADQTTQAAAADQATPLGQTTQASAATPAPADPAPQGTAPAAAPSSPPVWSLGPIDFSGTVDGYYSFNFNHPRPEAFFGSGNAGESNILYNFNIPANQFSLNLAKLALSHTADPVGFEFDLAYGDAMNQIASVSNPANNLFDNIVEQAYVSFKPAKAKGFEVDFGKFVTSAGAEVIESYSNWNYSRSLLFSWAIPYYHMGLRTSWPMGKHLTGGFQVVNGWNDTVAINGAATLGANATITYTKWNWVVDWYGGPGNSRTNQGWKNLIDTTLNLTASSKWAAYVNYDYGEYRFFDPSCQPIVNGNFCDGDFFKQNQYLDWQGIAGALHVTPTSKWAVTGRYEFFNDPQGAAMLLTTNNDGVAPNGSFGEPVRKNVQEVTGTVEYKFLEGLMWRGEYRYDWSDQPIFLSGDGPVGSQECDFAAPAGSPVICPAGFGLGNTKHQQTLTFAIIAFFGPKR